MSADSTPTPAHPPPSSAPASSPPAPPPAPLAPLASSAPTGTVTPTPALAVATAAPPAGSTPPGSSSTNPALPTLLPSVSPTPLTPTASSVPAGTPAVNGTAATPPALRAASPAAAVKTEPEEPKAHDGDDDVVMKDAADDKDTAKGQDKDAKGDGGKGRDDKGKGKADSKGDLKGKDAGGADGQQDEAVPEMFAARRAEENARRDRSLAEFLVMLDGYKPLIPEEVTEYYLQRAGFECGDPRLKRLLSLSAQKFMSDLSRDAFHFAKLRVSGNAAGRGRPAAAADRNRVVLTMDDLSLALGEHGVNVKKPDYYL